MDIEFLLKNLNDCAMLDKRPFCTTVGIEELFDQQTQSVFLRAMHQCGIDVTPVTKNNHPDALPLTTHEWFHFVEPKLMSQIQISDAAEYDLRQRFANMPEPKRPFWLSDTTIKILCALLQCNLFVSLQNGLIQASTQVRILSVLKSTKVSDKEIKDQLRNFFQRNMREIVLMTEYVLQACAAVALSKGLGTGKSHLEVNPPNALLSQGSAMAQAVQLATELAKKISKDATPLFTLKELGAFSQASMSDLDSAFNRGAKLFYKLTKEQMEPTSRLARVDHALERVGDKPHENPAWQFFKASVF